MRNKMFLILLAVGCCFFLADQMADAANWYPLPAMFVQHRVEPPVNGVPVEYNFFYFELPDGSGTNTSLTDPSQVVSFTLTDPNNVEVPVTINDMTFDTYSELAGRYNAGSGTWEWWDQNVATNSGWSTHVNGGPFGTFITHGEFYCHLPSTYVVVPGTYKLHVEMSNAQPFDLTYKVNSAQIALPMMKSSSIKVAYHSNPLDAVATWSAPSVDLVRQNPDLSTSARAQVKFVQKTIVKNKPQYTTLGELTITVPINMGMVYVPSSIMDTVHTSFGDKVDHVEMRLQTRTNDNNNRAQTKWITIKNPPKQQ